MANSATAADETAIMPEEIDVSFPTAGGVLLGIGLGGFIDGIVLHQILQWHHMLTAAGFPANSMDNLRFNTLWDGIFHASTWLFTFAGLLLFWRVAKHVHLWWSGKLLAGTLLMGWGIFNLVEGTVSHHLLNLHHVNQTVPRAQWIYWDVGFLAFGALMFIVGWALYRSGRRTMSAGAARRAA
jgi:uncharacterized membrane protein